MVDFTTLGGAYAARVTNQIILSAGSANHRGLFPGPRQQPFGTLVRDQPATPAPDKTPENKKQKGPISTQNTLLSRNARKYIAVMAVFGGSGM